LEFQEGKSQQGNKVGELDFKTTTKARKGNQMPFTGRNWRHDRKLRGGKMGSMRWDMKDYSRKKALDQENENRYHEKMQTGPEKGPTAQRGPDPNVRKKERYSGKQSRLASTQGDVLSGEAQKTQSQRGGRL